MTAMRVIAVFGTLSTIACGGIASKATRPDPRVHREISRSADDCGPSIQGEEQLFRSANIVLIGEWHGMRETPEMVAHLACVAVRHRSVTVGLEIPWTEQARFEQFLQSPGEDGDRARLLEGHFWTLNDGRGSRAMLQMIDRLRRLAQTTGRVRVVLLDMSNRTTATDAFMASRVLAAHQKSPADLFLVLTGNNHSRVTRGTKWDPDFDPMGRHIAEGVASTRSFRVGYAEGTAWYCYEPTTCGEAKVLGAVDRGTKAFVELGANHNGGYDGALYIGVPHASPPALADVTRKGTR